MKIKAKFKGLETKPTGWRSICAGTPFETGRTYKLDFQTGAEPKTIKPHTAISVVCDDIKEMRVYKSLREFLNQWQVIGG